MGLSNMMALPFPQQTPLKGRPWSQPTLPPAHFSKAGCPGHLSDPLQIRVTALTFPLAPAPELEGEGF